MRVSIGTDAGTGATAHVRFLAQETISQREDGLFPGIVQIPDHGAANATLGGIKPAPEKHEGTRAGPVRPALLRRA